MLARRLLILARYYGGAVPVPPEPEDSLTIPAIPPIDAPILPPVIDTLMDSLRVRPDSGKDSLVHQP
jgi:hypothetical protein